MPDRDFNVGERYRFHSTNTKVRVWDYIFRLHDALLASLAGKQLLYLDTCYWINLCDARIGRKQDERYKELFELLDLLKSEGRIACVATSSLLMEIDLQTDSNSRAETAELVSRFTDDVCLIDPHAAMRLEFKQHILRLLLGAAAPDLKSRYFTRPAWIFGVTVPVSPAASFEQNVLMAKVGADLAWSHGFAHILRESNGFAEHSLAEELASALRCSGREWLDQGLTYDAIRINIQSIYTHRLLGELRAILKELDDEYPHLVSKLAEPSRSMCEKSVEQMPHVQVLASAFAELISNKPKSINANDVADAAHAVMALPLCDVVFLDKGAAHMLSSRHDAISKKHQKMIYGKIDDLLRYLNALKSGGKPSLG